MYYYTNRYLYISLNILKYKEFKMETIKKDGFGLAKFVNGIIYKANEEEYCSWLEDRHCELKGVTYSSDERKNSNGEGVFFDIYSEAKDEANVTVWVNISFNEDGDAVYYFGEIE